LSRTTESDGYDSTYYGTAGSDYSSNNYALGVCLLDPPDVVSLFNRAARQSRSVQFWEGGVHHIRYVDSTDSIDKELSGHRINVDSLNLVYTDRGHIRNDVTAKYKRYWSGFELKATAVQAVVGDSDAGSQTDYGSIRGEYELDFVTDATMASALLAWIQGDMDEPRLIISFTGDISLIDLERGDVVNFAVDDEDDLDEAMLGIVASTDKFMVIDKSYGPQLETNITLLEL